MPLFDVLVLAGLLGLLAFQSYVTLRVFRSKLYERKQKILQTQLVWLLPVVGAGLVFSVLQDDERSARRAADPAPGEQRSELRS